MESQDQKIKTRQHQEKKFWDNLAKKYDRIMQGQYDRVTNEILNNISPEDKVLEIACGTGLISMAMAQKAHNVVGADISEAMIEVAKAKATQAGINNCTFQVEDGYQTSFDNDSFDKVVLCNVLHIVDNPGALLTEANRLIKPQGRIVSLTYCHAEKTTIVNKIFLLAMYLAKIVGKLPYLKRLRLEQLKEIFFDAQINITECHHLEGEEPYCAYIEGMKIH